MNSRPTGLMIMIAAVLVVAGNVLTIGDGEFDDEPLWKALVRIALLVSASVLAVLGFRMWKRTPTEE